MHGVKRFTPEKRAALRKENEERAASYRSRSAAAMERRAAKVYDAASLEAVAKVVTENPDFATMWNFRREVLGHMFPDADVAARKAACLAEFALTQECLGINPKSYPVWYHREWVLLWGECEWQWPVELKLTAKLLALDDRNFHCWTYRRNVVRVAGITAEAELAFTTTKIQANFSNYSAWHYRSKLLPAVHASAGAEGAAQLGAVLRNELEFVRNAFFTAPEDSSAWFYHRWLIAQLAPGADAALPPAEFEALVRAELQMVDELLELEPECKWPLAAAAFLGRTLDTHQMGSEETTGATATRIGELRRVDALRARYYDSAGEATPTMARTMAPTMARYYDSAGKARIGAEAPTMAPTGKWYRQKGNFYSTEPTELASELQ